MFLGYHSNLDEDSTISPTGAQSLSYSRSCLFLPPPPATPTPCTAETHHNPASSQHPPGDTAEHLNAQTLSPINSKQDLQLRLSPHPLAPSGGSVLPGRTAREITEWRGPPAARRSLCRPARRGSPIPPPLTAAITASLLTHVRCSGLPSPHRLARAFGHTLRGPRGCAG